MKKQSEDIIVQTRDGRIEIVQPYTYADQELKVQLHPDQVDVLIKWLVEAREELSREGAPLNRK